MPAELPRWKVLSLLLQSSWPIFLVGWIIGVLAAALVVLIGGGIYGYQVYKDPQPYIDKGDAMVARGNHRGATYQYRRAHKTRQETR